MRAETRKLAVAEQQACPRCGADNDGRQSFCGSCGAKLSLSCERCGATSPPGFKFAETAERGSTAQLTCSRRAKSGGWSR